MNNPVKACRATLALLLPFAAVAADKPEPVDVELIEFLGSVEAQNDSGREILVTIDAGLLPELPEEPPHERKK